MGCRLLLLVLLIIEVEGGPLCFSCSSTHHTRYCDYAQRCADHQVCQVRKILTNSGFYVFSSGCANNETCDLSKRTVEQHEPHGRITCAECCQGDMCNNKGCGESGPPTMPLRGPYCFNCDHMEDPSHCGQLTICGVDEVCVLEQHNLGFFGRQFSSGCKNKALCEYNNLFVGRDIHQRYEINPCCYEDFCNIKVHKVSHVAWTMWTSWSECGCEIADQTRNRTCLDQSTQIEEPDCVGASTEIRPCSNNTCQVPTVSHVAWTMWTSWSECGCGMADQTRNRTCLDQSTQTEVPNCVGALTEFRQCSNSSCQVPTVSHVTWTMWTSWSECGCGMTGQTRNRTCLDQSTQTEVPNCVGASTEFRPCSNSSCQVSHVEWTMWTSWSECACGIANQTRNRRCLDQTTETESSNCVGPSIESTECTNSSCQDCETLYGIGIRTNGIYTVSPKPDLTFNVYCDMEDGGWIVIQRRFDGHINFTRPWADYKSGFGNLKTEFWLGLEKIYKLTNPKRRSVKFELKTNDGYWLNGSYASFYIGSENTQYLLHVSGFNGSTSNDDRFSYNNGQKFYTYDHDNSYQCGRIDQGGWWHKGCNYLNINGAYGVRDSQTGMIIYTSSYQNLVATTMKIK